MKGYKLIGLCIAAVMITSCRATKDISTTIEKEKEKVSYTLPLKEKIYIDNICPENDTITIERLINTGAVETRVVVRDNTLTVETKADTIFKDKIVEKEKIVVNEKTITKTVWSKFTWWFLAIALGFIIFPKIPTFINKMIRSIIPL